MHLVKKRFLEIGGERGGQRAGGRAKAEGGDDGKTHDGFLCLDPALFRTERMKRQRRTLNFYSRVRSLLFYGWNLSSVLLYIVNDYVHFPLALVLLLPFLFGVDQLEPVFNGVFSSPL